MIINTVKEAEKFASTVEVGASWVFGGWPDPILDETPEEYDALMEKARLLEIEIGEIIDRGLLPKDEDTEPGQDKRTIKVRSTNEVKE